MSISIMIYIDDSVSRYKLIFIEYREKSMILGQGWMLWG
jgi:hypothetical protein